jgi:hypothetical protein
MRGFFVWVCFPVTGRKEEYPTTNKDVRMMKFS